MNTVYSLNSTSTILKRQLSYLQSTELLGLHEPQRHKGHGGFTEILGVFSVLSLPPWLKKLALAGNYLLSYALPLF
jgi:hypothetical protein